MTVGDKIKTINNKAKQNEVQYKLDWKTAKISALSSKNVDKYDFFKIRKTFHGGRIVFQWEKNFLVEENYYCKINKVSIAHNKVPRKTDQSLWVLFIHNQFCVWVFWPANSLSFAVIVQTRAHISIPPTQCSVLYHTNITSLS